MTTTEITLRLDLLPARVELSDGRVWERARLYVGMDRLYVWSDTPTGPAEVYTARLEDFSGRPVIGYTAVLTDGLTLTATRASGCLCGSRLRGIRPWTSVRQAPMV